MSDIFSHITDWVEWPKQAAVHVKDYETPEHLAAMPHVYDDTENTGHIYWWEGKIVAVAPAYDDGTVETENTHAAGLADGAPPDLYGRECLIGEKLATRFGNADLAAEYRRMAEEFFAEAEQTNCMHWAPEDRPPV